MSTTTTTMHSSSSSSSGSSSSFSTPSFASSSHPSPASVSSLWITQEELNAFYRIDRLLYSRLIIGLDCDPNQSVRIIALWLWLERNAHDMYMMCNIFYFPKWILKALAKEALIIFKCLENKKFPFSTHMNDIPLTRSLARHSIFSLPFFHENRDAIIVALSRIVSDVYSRAFSDIVDQVHRAKSKIQDRATSCVPSSRNTTNPNDRQRVYGPSMNQTMPGGQYPNNGVGSASNEGYLDLLMRPSGPHDITLERHMLKNDLSEAFSFPHLEDLMDGGGSSNSKVVPLPPDDRTIFLTFSKGYPISENEIWEYFSRKYGDIIEAIYMQEVIPEEQPLYARLIVQSASIIDTVLECKGKAKFSINGKHVWARKYVRKSTGKLLQSESSPSSSPPPPPPPPQQAMFAPITEPS